MNHCPSFHLVMVSPCANFLLIGIILVLLNVRIRFGRLIIILSFSLMKNYLFFQTVDAYARALTVAVQFSLEVSASYTSRMIIASPADCRSIYENLGGQNVRISDKVCL